MNRHPCSYLAIGEAREKNKQKKGNTVTYCGVPNTTSSSKSKNSRNQRAFQFKGWGPDLHGSINQSRLLQEDLVLSVLSEYWVFCWFSIALHIKLSLPWPISFLSFILSVLWKRTYPPGKSVKTGLWCFAASWH